MTMVGVLWGAIAIGFGRAYWRSGERGIAAALIGVGGLSIAVFAGG